MGGCLPHELDSTISRTQLLKLRAGQERGRDRKSERGAAPALDIQTGHMWRAGISVRRRVGLPWERHFYIKSEQAVLGCNLPCLEHFSAKWIRLAAKKRGTAKRKADSMTMETAPSG
jgi:hypothetical protein